MMSLRVSVLERLRQHGPLTDTQLRHLTGAQSHQHVNQVCRRLSESGIVRREAGPDGRLLNILVVDPAPATGTRRRPENVAASGLDEALGPSGVPPLDDPGVLIVLPCSARKRGVGAPRAAGPGLGAQLPTELSRELQAARDDLHRRISVDLGAPLPAIERYDGELYRALDRRRLMEARCSVVILSGGYGIVAATEAIGDYDQELRASDWRGNVLERALVAAARARGAHTVVGFLAASTSYAKIFRWAPWRELAEARVVLVSVSAGGSTGTTPRALGEALSESLDRPLSAEAWRASSGLTVAVSNLRRSRVAPSEHVEAAAGALRDVGRARRPDEVRADEPVWARPGLYAWWVDEAGGRDLGRDLGMQRFPHLIYAGQTGAAAWPSGRQRASTLGRRVRANHLRGNVRSSTFRRTLASLLVPAGDLRGPEASIEPQISSWMKRHLRVGVWPYDDRDRLADLESRVLEVIDPPLNLEGREASDLRTRIAGGRGQLG